VSGSGLMCRNLSSSTLVLLSLREGVLTVADDLLRNDGQRFLEMMEHLAERRLFRERALTAQAKPMPNHSNVEEEDRSVPSHSFA